VQRAQRGDQQTPKVLKCGAAVLQDLAVAVADSVADAYLAEAGVNRVGMLRFAPRGICVITGWRSMSRLESARATRMLHPACCLRQMKQCDGMWAPQDAPGIMPICSLPYLFVNLIKG
jgi:hypothetical protein